MPVESVESALFIVRETRLQDADDLVAGFDQSIWRGEYYNRYIQLNQRHYGSTRRRVDTSSRVAARPLQRVNRGHKGVAVGAVIEGARHGLGQAAQPAAQLAKFVQVNAYLNTQTCQ